MTSTIESGTLGTTSSELESEEMSMEMTVPTDLTLSLESDLTGMARRWPGGTSQGDSTLLVRNQQLVTRQLLERKQLLHDLQLMKIELSQKTLIIDNLKADTMARTEKLEEETAEIRHSKQILQAQLESQLQIQERETQLELSVMRRKQIELEETNTKLQEGAMDLRRTLCNLELDEQQYGQLLTQDPNQLSLRDFIAVKIFEMVRPHQIETANLKTKCHQLVDENKIVIACNENLKKDLEEENIRANDFKAKLDKCLCDLKKVQNQVKIEDYKVENYDQVKSERDQFMEQALEAKNTLSIIEASKSATERELEEIKAERIEISQKISLLQQDKDFLSKRVAEVLRQNRALEDHLAKSQLQLNNVTQAREALYEKYVSCRDTYKSDFEKKLKEEVADLHKKTSSEIGLLKSTTQIGHEQELRALKEARDFALQQRDTAESSKRLIMEKYLMLLDQLKAAENDRNMNSSNLKGQLMLKTSELDQLRLVHSETQRTHQELKLENEKLLNKIQILETEIHSIEHKMLDQLDCARKELAEKTAKLNVYQKVEDELDNVIMHAAEEQIIDGSLIIQQFGNDAGLPVSVKRRMQHSFKLAKQILLLEKQNAQLRQQLQKNKMYAEKLSEELQSMKDVLDNADKPNSHLVDIIRRKDCEIMKLKQKLAGAQEQNGLYESNHLLTEKQISSLTMDIQKLLSHKEEISKMKSLLTNIFPHHLKYLQPPTT